MNRVLRLTSAAVICVLTVSGLVACAGKKSSTTSEKAPTTLQAVMSDESDDVSPFTPNEQGKSQILSAIDMLMMQVDPSGKIVSNLFASWSESASGTSVTLKLKPNLQWSDGKPITSADVITTLTAYLDAKIDSNAGRVGAVVGADAVSAGTATTVSGLAAPDASTVNITLAQPDGAWIAQLAAIGGNLPLLPSHILSTVALSDLASNAFFKTWPVSSGPYTLAKFVPDQYAQLTRNDNWSLGKANFPTVVLQVLSTDQMQAKLQTGEVQYVYTVDPSDVSRLKTLPNVTIATAQGVAPDVYAMNNASPLLSDPRIRQAMVYAIDRQSICKTILAGFCTVSGPNLRQIGPSWSIPTSGLIQYNYDPTKAKELLKEANWDPSTPIIFLARTQRSYVDQAVTAAVGQLRAVGFNVQIRNITTAQLLDTISKPTGWDMFWVSGADFVTDPSEWSAYLLCSARYPNGGNTSQYCNPAVDKLLEAGGTAVSQDARATNYKQAFTLVNQDPAEIYPYDVDSIIAYNSHLTGVTASGNLAAGYDDIGKWGWKS